MHNNNRGELEMKFYAVRVDKKSWTKETVTIEEHKEKGFDVKESRKDGIYNVYSGGFHVSTLFPSKAQAMAYFES
jgi:regulator of replication initiation timing